MAFVIGLFTWACGGGDEEVPIRGGERLAWEQRAPSLARAQSYQFLLYVDGEPRELAAPRCEGQQGPSVFVCSGGLPAMSPGPHVLQLVTVENGAESQRSAPLTVVMSSGGTSSLGAVAPASVTRTSIADRQTCDSGAGECYDAHLVVSGEAGITALSVVNDGRLLFVENGRHVRVVAGQALLPDPAFSVERTTDRIIALHPDQDFGRTGIVRVAWIEEPGTRPRTLTVARFRDVQDRFGEGAVVLSGLTLPATGDPQVAFDNANRIYVALPADTSASRREAYGGALLRFTDEGGIPWRSGQSSPLLVQGFATPTAITNDSTANRVWLAGKEADGRPAIGEISWDGNGHVTRAALNSTAFGEGVRRVEDSIVSLTIVESAGAQRSTWMFLVDSMGQVFRSSLSDAARPGDVEQFPVEFGKVSSVTGGRNGELYAAVTGIRNDAQSVAILRLAPRSR